MKKNLFRMIGAGASLVLLTASLAACGSKDQSTSSANSASSAASTVSAASAAVSTPDEEVNASSVVADSSATIVAPPSENMLDQVSSSETFETPQMEEAFSLTDIKWDFTADSMKKALGDPTSEESGTYSYDGCSFNGHLGVADFTFGEDGKLATLSWTYAASSMDDLTTVQADVTAAATEAYGEPVASEKYITDWVTDDYNVEVQAMMDKSPMLYYRIFTKDAMNIDVTSD